MALYNGTSSDNYMSLVFSKSQKFSIQYTGDTAFVIATWSSPDLRRENQQSKFLIAENGDFSVLFGREKCGESNKAQDTTHAHRTGILFKEGIGQGLLFRVTLSSNGELSGQSLADVEARLQPDSLMSGPDDGVSRMQASAIESDLDQKALASEECLRHPARGKLPYTLPITPHLISTEEETTSALDKMQENLEAIQTTIRSVSPPNQTAHLGPPSRFSPPASPQASAANKPKPKSKSKKKKTHSKNSSQSSGAFAVYGESSLGSLKPTPEMAREDSSRSGHPEYTITKHTDEFPSRNYAASNHLAGIGDHLTGFYGPSDSIELNPTDQFPRSHLSREREEQQENSEIIASNVFNEILPETGVEEIAEVVARVAEENSPNHRRKRSRKRRK